MHTIREGLCYRINDQAGTHHNCGDHSTKADRGKKVRAMYCFEKMNLVQVLDLKDPQSRFNIKKSCLDSL